MMQIFNFKRFFIFKLIPKKIKISQIEKLLLNKKNAFIILILNEKVQENKDIQKIVSNNLDLILKIERFDFKNWFNSNKDKYQKYIFLNNNMHVKQEYRWVRNQNYLSYLVY